MYVKPQLPRELYHMGRKKKELNEGIAVMYCHTM